MMMAVPKVNVTHSLRGRLLWFLLAAITMAAVAQAMIAYSSALNDADQIFDYHMQQMAMSLRSNAPMAATGNRDPNDPGNDEMVVQVWTPDGIQVFRSLSRAELPQRAVLGFSNVRANGTTYRVFSAQTATQTIQIAQDLAVRKRMAGTLALRTVGPIALMAPVLMLVVWWVVSGSLAPVARVQRQLASRKADDLSEVSDAELPDEVRPLVQELNLLFKRVQTALRRTNCAPRWPRSSCKSSAWRAPTATRRATWRSAACRPGSSALRAWSSNCWCWPAPRPPMPGSNRSA
jgi:two-component system OmpR family sensor kinase